MFKKFLIVTAVLLIALLGFAASKPDTFLVQRTISIKAPPEKVFPLINDFHHWPEWSPFEKLDPGMGRTFSGTPQGKGAIYEWNGNAKAGSGRMEIIDALPQSKVVISLNFIKPFKVSNTAEFTLEKQNETTNVTWAMHGPVSFPFKILHVFINVDNMVGKDFEAGLANLKALAEK